MAKKPTVTTLASGFNSTETLNANFEALRDGFDNTLSLDGSTPNAMEADLDLNGNNIIGAAGLLINGTDYLADVTAAKAAALVAQAAAETAETNAETAETNAEASETAVGLSATAAATSATASAASAVDATNNGAAQVALAAGQVTLATTAKTGAELAETNAETAESNASTSATSAATSASTASTGASTATTKASEAATSATNAATSATESETAKDAAETARDAALAALDNFDDRYLGAKASAPTVDNDGNALIVGALYFNTGTDKLYIWNGTAWQITTSGGASGDLISTNNLSDVTSASTSRTNLGLVTVASTGSYSDLTGTPTLGTAAATASTDYATAAQGTLAASAVQPNDSPTFGSIIATGAAASYTDTGLYLQNKGSSVFDVGAWRSGASAAELTFSTDSGSDAAPVEAMRIDSSGNVGIGTTNPAYTLDVQGTGDTIARIYTGGTTSSDDAMLFLNIAGTTATTRLNFGDAGDADAGRIIYGHSGDYMSFTTAASEAMRIDSNGKVGIGTSIPTSLLDVVSSGTTAETIAEFGNASVNDGLSIETNGNLEWGFNTKNSRSMTFSTNQTERMRINGSGNVGIGKTNPATALDVAGTVTADGLTVEGAPSGAGLIKIIDSDGPNESRLTQSGSHLYVDNTSTGSLRFRTDTNKERLSISSGGDVSFFPVAGGGTAGFFWDSSTERLGIGKTNPATPLDVTGTVTATAFAGDGSALTGVGGSTTYGAVGTYGLFYRASAGQNAPATTTAGSNLVPANTYTHSSTWGGYSGSGSPSGTWRLMGETGYYNNTIALSRMDLYTSVYVRIS